MAPSFWVLRTIMATLEALTCSALLTYSRTHLILNSLGGRYSIPHIADSDIESLRCWVAWPASHSPWVVELEFKPRCVNIPTPTFHSPTNVDPGFLKSKLSPSPSRSFFLLWLHAPSHLMPDGQITLNFSQFLKPVLSLATQCLQAFLFVPGMLISLSLPGWLLSLFQSPWRSLPDSSGLT